MTPLAVAQESLASIGPMPYSKKLAVTSPSTTQNTNRNAIEPKPAAMPTPRISTAVSARPTMPANIGVKPLNSMNTSTASGNSRYQRSLIACQGRDTRTWAGR